MKYSFCIISILALGISYAGSAMAATDMAETQTEPATLAQDLRSGFYSRINVLGFGTVQGIRDSQTNLNASRIPRYQTEIDVRPDFNLNFRQFEFGVKPRFQYARNKIETGTDASSYDTSHHFFINGAFARYRMTDKLLAIYGRENLQWGPSSLLSPSNPFNANNGKNNPSLELPGLDFVRLVAIPNSALTMSLIANTGPGRLEKNTSFSPFNPFVPLDSFEKTYAAKVDYTGDGHYFSVISSYRERDHRHRLGLFGGWNVSDALLIYAEGSGAKKADNPPTTRNDYQLLLGSAYTLEAGPTITLEYFHNNNGCDLTGLSLCMAQQPLTLDPRYPLLRRRYALLQYVDSKIGGNLNLAVRLIKNIDDNSNLLSANLEYEMGRNWQLYLVPTLYGGKRDSEFGNSLRHSTFIGASYTF